MAKLKESYKKLIESDEFIKWKQEHHEYKLQVAFFSRNIKDEPLWSFSFVSNEKLHTFDVCDNVECKGMDDIYIESIEDIKNLNIDDIELSFEQVSEKIKDMTTSYVIVKEVCTVSNNKEYGLHWNITEVTADMKMVNLKISNDGIILKQTEQSLLNLGQWQKGTKQS